MFEENRMLWQRVPVQENFTPSKCSEACNAWQRSPIYQKLGEHVEFLCAFLEEYKDVLGNSYEELNKEYQKVLERYLDDNLYLVVIGTFSSGKSTLINAFLGLDLLKTDILQGTTKTAIKVMYGNEYSLEMHSKDGLVGTYTPNPVWWRRLFMSKRKRREWNQSQINQTIEYYDGVNNIESSFPEIILKVPSTYLKNTGIVIVDTPGINSSVNPLHDEITKRTVDNIADVILVLTVAEQIASSTFGDFIAETLKEKIDKCYFMMTKADNIEDIEEMPRLIISFKKRLERQLCNMISYDQIDYCAAKYAEIEFNKLIHKQKEVTESIDLWNKKFYQTKDKIRSELIKRRIQVQIYKNVQLMKRIYIDANEQLELQKQSLTEKCLELEKNTIKNLDDYVRGEENFCKKEVLSIYEALVEDIRHFVQTSNKQIIERCTKRIVFAKNVNEIENYINEDFSNDIKCYVNDLNNQLNDKLIKRDREIDSQFKMIEKRFHENYAMIEKISLKPSSTVFTDFNIIDKNINPFLTQEIQILNQKIESQNAPVGASVGIGAVIGTFLLPGIGTILGGLAGKFLSTFFGPSLEERKTKVANSVTDIVEQISNEVLSQMQIAIDDRCNQQLTNLYAKIVQYYSMYEKLIAELNKLHDQERIALKNQEHRIARISNTIIIQQMELQAIQEESYLNSEGAY